MDAYLPPLWPTVVVLSLLGSVVGVGWLARERTTWDQRLTDRLLFGVPWGSIIALSVVLAVYLVVQDGIGAFDRPIFLPYVNWSYFYPTGVVLAPFAHASAAHLTSNLTTAAVLAPLAEYIWGHYPETDRGHLRDLPVVRACLIVPGVILGVGILTSLFTWGPVIGFSGVVYGLAGFTVLRYPVITIAALLARSALREVVATIRNPVVVSEVSNQVVTPGWVGVSFQGHAIGFLMGTFLGVLLIYRRGWRPDPIRVWIGLVLVMIGTSLWAIWSSRGEDVYVLYRGLGIALIFVIALLVTAAAVASDREIRGWFTYRRVAIVGVAIPLLILAGMALPLNALAVTDHEAPDRAISIEGYDVFYDRDVPNHLRPFYSPDEVGGNASGVIVVHEERHIWTEAISSGDLDRSGEATIALGEAFDRTEVTANRSAWDPVGNDSVYRVELTVEGTSTPAYASEPKTADVRLAGYEIAIGVDHEDGFHVAVIDGEGERLEGPLPAENASIELGEITFERDGRDLLGRHDGTHVRIARSDA